jgi:TonB family protein
MSNGDADNTEEFRYKADSLKSNSLDQEHKRPISAVQPILNRRQRKGNRASKSLAWTVSLVFHLFVALFAGLHIAQNVAIDDDDAVVANILRAEDIPKKRRLRQRVVKKIVPDVQRTQTIQPRRPITKVQISPGDGALTIPSDSLEIDSSDAPPVIPRLERPPVSGGLRPNIETKIPKIAPTRADKPQILDKFETVITQVELELEELVDVPIVDTNDNTKPPKSLHKRKPKYPEAARRAGKEGVVRLEATIGTDGKAKDIKVIEGIGFGCDEAAIEALKKSRFTPAEKDGKPVDRRIIIPYRFKIED